MHINKIGYHHSHDASLFIQRPAGSGDYLLLLVFTPSRMILEENEIISQEPFFILYEQGVPQNYGAYEDIYMDDWIHFSMEEKELSLIRQLGIVMNTPVVLDNLDELSHMMQAMTYEYHSTHPLHQENLNLYLRLFFHKLSENFNDTANRSPHFPIFNRIRTRIYNEPYLEYSVDSLAREANLSRSSFQHIYHDIFHVNVSTDIRKARIDHGRYLLSSTLLPVYQIADMCGYHSEIHFMRQFKQQMKMTPSEYRKNLPPTNGKKIL